MSRSKELIKNTSILFIGKISTQFLSFLLIPLYTFLLSPDEYGTIDLILTYITLLMPIITIQQEMATFRHLIDARSDKVKTGRIIATSVKSTLIRLVLFAIPYLILTSIFHWKYAYLVLFCGVFSAISNLLLQTARGLGNNTQYAIGSIIAGLVTVSSSLLLICASGCGGEAILISMALANLCTSLYLFIILDIVHFLSIATPSTKLSKDMLAYSWPLVPNGISWWLINASDRTIISFFLNAAANGIYAITMKIPAIVSSLLNIFVMSWTESASIHINDNDRDKFFSNVAKNTIKIFSSLSILLVAVLPFLFNIIIGPEYHEAYAYIPIAIIGTFFNCIVSIYSAIYVAKKMTKQVATTSAAAAIINIVTNLILIHFIGLYAAVLSTALAFLVMATYRHFDLKKYVKITYQVGDIIPAIIAFFGITIIYYSDNLTLYIIGVILAVCYTIIQNTSLLKRVFNYIRTRS